MSVGIPKNKWFLINLVGVGIAIVGMLLVKSQNALGWLLIMIGVVLGLFYFKK